MLSGLSTRILQHLIAQNSWACPLLQPHAGKCVAFKLGFFSHSLTILEDGSLAMAGDSHAADASVSLTPSLALRLLSGDEAAKRQVVISGDTHLAAELAKVLSAMRWDFEDDASKLVGDVAAHKIGQTLRGIAANGKETGSNLAAMLSEYWQEEMPLIAKKRQVEAFNSEVDTLRADLARFEKKFAKLQQQLKQPGQDKGSQA
jgi:ubiquinone biosynthesis protein UbiJ